MLLLLGGFLMVWSKLLGGYRLQQRRDYQLYMFLRLVECYGIGSVVAMSCVRLAPPPLVIDLGRVCKL